MTIYEIKKRTKKTAPYFFSSDTLRFNGQKLTDFKVEKEADGRYKISAPVDPFFLGYKYLIEHKDTVRYFNPKNNVLENSCGCTR